MYGLLNSFFEKTIALLVVLFLILILLRPVSRRVLRIQLQPLTEVIGIGLGGALVLNVVVVLWQRVVGDSGGSQLQAFGAGEGALSDVFLVLSIVAIAPVVEELLFRALLYLPLREALSRFGRPVAVGVAGFLNAFAFAGIHLDATQVPLFPVYVVYGVVTVAAYELPGRLMAAVVLHASSNAWALLSPGAASIVSTPTQALAVVAVPVATALALLGGFVLDALGGDDRRSAHAN